uniref:Uncharacterized protein n=2 Tax=Cacopsylla melanoneura TaxID=428564 RepID=A0A8D8ZWN0_9HEMI
MDNRPLATLYLLGNLVVLVLVVTAGLTPTRTHKKLPSITNNSPLLLTTLEVPICPVPNCLTLDRLQLAGQGMASRMTSDRGNTIDIVSLRFHPGPIGQIKKKYEILNFTSNALVSLKCPCFLNMSLFP